MYEREFIALQSLKWKKWLKRITFGFMIGFMIGFIFSIAINGSPKISLEVALFALVFGFIVAMCLIPITLSYDVASLKLGRTILLSDGTYGKLPSKIRGTVAALFAWFVLGKAFSFILQHVPGTEAMEEIIFPIIIITLGLLEFAFVIFKYIQSKKGLAKKTSSQKAFYSDSINVNKL